MADTRVLEPRRVEKVAVRREVRTVRTVGRPDIAAYRTLHLAFVVAPILAGLDKFFHWLVNWDMYLAPAVERILPVPGSTFMRGVGVVEIAAGVLVAAAPQIGGFVVAFWLWGIIVNLLMIPGFYDIALRDFGLSLGALALGWMALARRRRSEPAPAA